MPHTMRQLLSICLMTLMAYTLTSQGETGAPLNASTELNESTLPTAAQLIYITDNLSTALRTGPGTQYRIIAFLKSGTALKPRPAGDRDGKGKWTSVTTLNNKVGWVESTHISKKPSGKKALSALQEKVKSYSAKLKQAEDSIARLSEERDDLALQLMSKQADHQRLKSVSGKSIEIDEDNKRLNEELSLAKIRLEEISIENGQLKESKYIDGITHGIIAVIVGCLLTLILPRLNSTKKRTNGWD